MCPFLLTQICCPPLTALLSAPESHQCSSALWLLAGLLSLSWSPEGPLSPLEGPGTPRPVCPALLPGGPATLLVLTQHLTRPPALSLCCSCRLQRGPD